MLKNLSLLFSLVCVSFNQVILAQDNIEQDAEEFCNCLTGAEIYSLEELENAFDICLENSDIADKENEDRLESLKNVLIKDCAIVQQLILSGGVPNFSETDLTPNDSIFGRYSLNRGTPQPEGSPTLFIYKPDIYTIFYFGGAQVGRVNVYKNKYAKFTPYKNEFPFTVHARHNPTLKDSTKVAFFGRSIDDANYVNFNTKTTSEYQRIYNEGANCFDFPAVKTIVGISKKIELTKIIRQPNIKNDVYTFENTELYNDFLIRYNEDYYDNQSFVATLVENGLQIRGGFHKRRPLDENLEEIDTMIDIIKTELSPKVVVCNLGYNDDFSEELIEKNYDYHETDNAYHILEDYYNDTIETTDYHNENILLKYEPVLLEKSLDLVAPSKSSVLYSVCD